MHWDWDWNTTKIGCEMMEFRAMAWHGTARGSAVKLALGPPSPLFMNLQDLVLIRNNKINNSYLNE